MDEAAVEETMPVLCETSYSETISPEKYLPRVREGSIDDGAVKDVRFGVGILMRDAHVSLESCAGCFVWRSRVGIDGLSRSRIPRVDWIARVAGQGTYIQYRVFAGLCLSNA